MPDTADSVKITVAYERKGDVMTKTETPDKIVPVTTSYDVASITAEIARIDFAISEWQAKRAPLQAIVDQHNLLTDLAPKDDEDGKEPSGS